MKKFCQPDKKSASFQIAKPGYTVIFACAFITAIFAMLGLFALTIIFSGITIFYMFFFSRSPACNPRRGEYRLVARGRENYFRGAAGRGNFFSGRLRQGEHLHVGF